MFVMHVNVNDTAIKLTQVTQCKNSLCFQTELSVGFIIAIIDLSLLLTHLEGSERERSFCEGLSFYLADFFFCPFSQDLTAASFTG